MSALLLLFALPCAAQRGAEPELVPRFAPLKKLPKAEPLKAMAEDKEEPAYKILPPPTDLMRKPRASELGAKSERREFLRARTRVWFYRGGNDSRMSRQIPPANVTPSGTEVWEGETETFASEGIMLVHSAELAPLSWLSLQAEYGLDKKSKGPYRDSYWIHAPTADNLTNTGNGATWQNPEREDDLVYAGKSHGESEWMAANLYLRVLEARIAGQDDDAFRHALDLGVGVHQLKLRHRVTDLAVTQSDGKYFDDEPIGPVSGHNSTYEALWRGGHIAIRDTVNFPKRFFLEGEAFWAPVGMEFRGDGFDNLSVGVGGLRAEGPNYEDRARGSAIHFRFAGGWSWGPLTLEGGYQRLFFYSRTGRRRYHNIDGSKTEIQLDVATAELGGFFAGASFRF